MVMILSLLSEVASFSFLPSSSLPLGLEIRINDNNNAYAAVSNVANGWIAFSVFYGGGNVACEGEIQIMNADDISHRVKIPGTSGCGSHASISPDGKKIVFDKPVWDYQVGVLGGSEIFAVNVNGTNLVSLTNKNYTDVESNLPHTYTTRSDSPSVSPDGKKIVFSRWNRNAHTYSYSIYVMNATDGSGVVRLTKNDAVVDGEPSFSPDGKKIVFVRSSGKYGDPTTSIYTMNAEDGSNQINLTPNSTSANSSPSFSPDGKKIVFVSDRDGTLGIHYINIYTMNAEDGTQLKRLTKLDNYYTNPAWSPDGKKIAFVKGREIFVMNAEDGSNQERLTHTGERWDNILPSYYSLSWFPALPLSLPPDSISTDAIPPRLTITYPTDGTAFNITDASLSTSLRSIVVTGNASDRVSGVARVEVSIDNGKFEQANGTTSWSYPTFKSWLSSSSLSPSTPVHAVEGTHQITVRAIDRAGNAGTRTLTISLHVQHQRQGGQQVPPPPPLPVPMPLYPIIDNKVIAISNNDNISSSCMALSGHGGTIVWNSTSHTCTIANGTLVISKTGSLTIGGGNGGSSSITLEIAQTATLRNEGTISNIGRIRISDGGMLVNTGTISSSGIIVNNKHGTIENQGIICNSNTIDNYGVIHNNDNNAITNNNNNVGSGYSGRLVNSGYINSNNLGGKIKTDHAGAIINSGYLR